MDAKQYTYSETLVKQQNQAGNIMVYEHTLTGTFLVRKNRFTAHVIAGEQEIICHVKNTGRLRELLYPGVSVILQFHPDAEALGRKTAYSLIAVYKEEAGFSKEKLLINIDSQAPNSATAEWLADGHFSDGITAIRREVSFGSSRFDLSFLRNGQPALMEVKGVTLEQDGTACFPDAPTERGVKHVTELIQATHCGFEAYILFVIQMKGILAFKPNRITHPVFADALLNAKKAGVHILARDCAIAESSIKIDSPVPVHLSHNPADSVCEEEVL